MSNALASDAHPVRRRLRLRARLALQLAFVAVVLASGWLIHRIKGFPVTATEMVATYVIGGMAAYWTIERVAGFWV